MAVMPEASTAKEVLDAFGDQENAAEPGEVNEELNEVAAKRISIQVGHQLAIEFEPVGAQPHDAVEAAGSRTDIVDRKLEAMLAKRVGLP